MCYVIISYVSPLSICWVSTEISGYLLPKLLFFSCFHLSDHLAVCMCIQCMYNFNVYYINKNCYIHMSQCMHTRTNVYTYIQLYVVHQVLVFFTCTPHACIFHLYTICLYFSVVHHVLVFLLLYTMYLSPAF